MKFNDGAEVYTADGKKLGHLGRVILNPHTKQVTDIVVHKGTFFTSDKVIPVGDIQQTLADRVTLRHEAKADAYPDYLESHFVPLVGDDATAQVPSPVLWYPPLEMMVYNPMFNEPRIWCGKRRTSPQEPRHWRLAPRWSRMMAKSRAT